MKKEKNLAYKVSFISIVLNVFLSVFKFIAGIIGKSSAMISDSIHSLSDVISTFVVIIGITISKKEADVKHQYGHERYETLAAIILSFCLALTGIYIFYKAIANIVNKSYVSKDVTFIALIAAIISILVKEWMYHYTKKAALKINSTSLKADAYHHRSDSLSSIGAMIGILGSILGYKILDPIAAIIISILIIKSAIDIMLDAFDKVMDASADEITIDKIRKIVIEIEGVMRIDDIKTRMFGDKIYVDIEIAVLGDKTLKEAHEISHLVHDIVEKEIKNCKHCMVHVNPYE